MLMAIHKVGCCLPAGFKQIKLPLDQRTGQRGEFGSWIFRVAARTGTPVVPIAFRGAWERNHVGSFLITPGMWEVEILPPIISTGGDRAAAETLKRAVEEAIDRNTR